MFWVVFLATGNLEAEKTFLPTSTNSQEFPFLPRCDDLTSFPGAPGISHQPRSFREGLALGSVITPLAQRNGWWGEQKEPQLFAASPKVAPFK